MTHNRRRPITEIYPERFCGCGRKVRYIAGNRDSSEDACNKYGRCASWDELNARLAALEAAAKSLHGEFDSIWNSSRTPTREQVHRWGRELRDALNLQHEGA